MNNDVYVRENIKKFNCLDENSQLKFLARCSQAGAQISETESFRICHFMTVRENFHKQGRPPIQDNNNSYVPVTIHSQQTGLHLGGEAKGAFAPPPLCQILSTLGVNKLLCKHTNLDCCPPKIFNILKFLFPLNKISR